MREFDLFVDMVRQMDADPGLAARLDADARIGDRLAADLIRQRRRLAARFLVKGHMPQGADELEAAVQAGLLMPSFGMNDSAASDLPPAAR